MQLPISSHVDSFYLSTVLKQAFDCPLPDHLPFATSHSPFFLHFSCMVLASLLHLCSDPWLAVLHQVLPPLWVPLHRHRPSSLRYCMHAYVMYTIRAPDQCVFPPMG